MLSTIYLGIVVGATVAEKLSILFIYFKSLH